VSYLMRMLAWVNLLQTDGMVNRLLLTVGLFRTPYDWLGGQPLTVILGLVYGYIPYMILPLYGFLDRIDASLLEAARDLGASRVQTFLRVTMPLSKQALAAACLIVALPIVSDYYTNDLLSGSPRTTMVANQINNLLYSQSDGPALGSAMVFLLMLAMVVPMLWYLRLVGKEDLFEPPEPVPAVALTHVEAQQ
jgi:ABC-type spermidine/putrescine transport system permease subunit I